MSPPSDVPDAILPRSVALVTVGGLARAPWTYTTIRAANSGLPLTIGGPIPITMAAAQSETARLHGGGRAPSNERFQRRTWGYPSKYSTSIRPSGLAAVRTYHRIATTPTGRIVNHA
jgi:hypothetical protein